VAWIDTIGPGEAEGELAALYRRCADPETGAVDNVMTVHALHPQGLAAHLAVYRAAMRGSRGLPKVDRELVAVVVSQLNGCRY